MATNQPMNVKLGSLEEYGGPLQCTKFDPDRSSRKNTKLSNFRILSSLAVPPSLLHKKIECGCTSTNLNLSNSTKLVSQLQLLHGDIAFTISVFPNARRTKKNKKKTLNFLLPWWHAKAQRHQTWHGDRGSPPHFGRSKHVPLRLIVLPLGDVENFWGKRPRVVKPLTSEPFDLIRPNFKHQSGKALPIHAESFVEIEQRKRLHCPSFRKIFSFWGLRPHPCTDFGKMRHGGVLPKSVQRVTPAGRKT